MCIYLSTEIFCSSANTDVDTTCTCEYSQSSAGCNSLMGEGRIHSVFIHIDRVAMKVIAEDVI